VKKVNKNSPTLRENSLALLCIFSGQTAHSPRHYTRNAWITKIGRKEGTQVSFLPRLGHGAPKATKKMKKGGISSRSLLNLGDGILKATKKKRGSKLLLYQDLVMAPKN
jgi:hypothetical protein